MTQHSSIVYVGRLALTSSLPAAGTSAYTLRENGVVMIADRFTQKTRVRVHRPKMTSSTATQ